MSDKVKIKNRVKAIRESKELTQSQVAQAMGVQVQTVSNIENGRYMPRPITARKLARVLGVTVEELFNGDTEEEPIGTAA